MYTVHSNNVRIQCEYEIFGFSLSIRSMFTAVSGEQNLSLNIGPFYCYFIFIRNFLILFFVSVVRMLFPIYELLKLMMFICIIFALFITNLPNETVLNIEYLYIFAFDTRCDFPFLIFAIWQSGTVPVIKLLCECITNCEIVRDNCQQ